MVEWHHRLNGHEFGLTPGVGEGQGGLACCSSWGHKGSDTTEQLNYNYWILIFLFDLIEPTLVNFLSNTNSQRNITLQML